MFKHKAGSKYRTQSYRAEWEKENWTKHWIKRSAPSSSKAYCKVCYKHLAVGKSYLIKHSWSQVHITIICRMQTNSSMDSFVGSKLTCVKAELFSGCNC